MLLSRPLYFVLLNNFDYFFASILVLVCRKINDRPRDPAKWDEIADVVSSISIPVVANGDVFDYEDFQRIKLATVEIRSQVVLIAVAIALSHKLTIGRSFSYQCTVLRHSPH
ncbi:hypothetical protein RND81_14G143800 [Saponaria officinalis]|uniref:DUS-like FMN-binding domain-containing protein n=1 Tax=Saponaria officinalis TaxID=3572 RepID=A0AAW1GSH2_SAPOF